MVQFVKSVDIKTTVDIKSLTDREKSCGYILDVVESSIKTLFDTQRVTYVVFKDLVHDCIVKNAIIYPDSMATIRLTYGDHVRKLFNKDMYMNGANTLETLAKLRSKYDINYAQAEFVLLAFYMINKDQVAYNTHQIWKKYTEKVNGGQQPFDVDEIQDVNLLPYLDSIEREGLLEAGFFESLTTKLFKINKKQFYNEIFINKEVAYNQLTDVFQGVATLVNNTSYKVCNVVDRAKAVNEYWVSIDGLIDRHVAVLDACEYAIANDLISTGLNKIIANTEYNDWVMIVQESDNNDDDDSPLESNNTNIVCV